MAVYMPTILDLGASFKPLASFLNGYCITGPYVMVQAIVWAPSVVAPNSYLEMRVSKIRGPSIDPQ